MFAFSRSCASEPCARISLLSGAVVASSLLAGGVTASATALTDFGLIAFGDLDGTSNVQGRTFVGGDIVGGTKDFVTQPRTPGPVSTTGLNEADGLIVGGQIFPQQIQVNNQSNVRVGGASTDARINNAQLVTFSDPEVPTIAASITADVAATGSFLAGLTANSTVDLSDGNNAVFNSTPDASGVAVFELETSFFNRNGGFDLEGNLDADFFVFLVNGSGDFRSGTALNVFNNEFGQDEFLERIVFSFAGFDSVELSNGLGGSVFAPDADFTLRSPVRGTVVANNVNLLAQIGLPTSSVPEPGTAALVLAGGAMLLRRRKAA